MNMNTDFRSSVKKINEVTTKIMDIFLDTDENFLSMNDYVDKVESDFTEKRISKEAYENKLKIFERHQKELQQYVVFEIVKLMRESNLHDHLTTLSKDISPEGRCKMLEEVI